MGTEREREQLQTSKLFNPPGDRQVENFDTLTEQAHSDDGYRSCQPLVVFCDSAQRWKDTPVPSGCTFPLAFTKRLSSGMARSKRGHTTNHARTG